MVYSLLLARGHSTVFPPTPRSLRVIAFSRVQPQPVLMDQVPIYTPDDDDDSNNDLNDAMQFCIGKNLIRIKPGNPCFTN